MRGCRARRPIQEKELGTTPSAQTTRKRLRSLPPQPRERQRGQSPGPRKSASGCGSSFVAPHTRPGGSGVLVHSSASWPCETRSHRQRPAVRASEGRAPGRSGTADAVPHCVRMRPAFFLEVMLCRLNTRSTVRSLIFSPVLASSLRACSSNEASWSSSSCWRRTCSCSLCTV